MRLACSPATSGARRAERRRDATRRLRAKSRAGAAGWRRCSIEVEPDEPPAGLWGRIESGDLGKPVATNVVQLRRRVGLWRGATAAA